MRSPSPYGVAEDGVSSTLSIFNRIGTSLHQGPHVGRLDSNQHPLVALPLSYTPDGRRSTRPRLSNRHASASYWRSTGRKTIHGLTAAWTGPATPSTTESSRDRVHIREWFAGGAGLEPATYGSKDRRAANCTTRLYHAACAAAMVTVCAPNHPLGALRRCRRRRTLPACTPPCFAWSAATRWMPWGTRHMDSYARRCPRLAGSVSLRASGRIRTCDRTGRNRLL